MTIAGWITLGICVSLVIAFVTWCFYKVFTDEESSPDEHALRKKSARKKARD